MPDSLVNAVLTGGVFTALGAIGAALVNAFNGRPESRARAADLIAGAAGGLVDRLGQANGRLETENRNLREVVTVLVDTVTLLLDHAIDVPSPVVASAHESLSIARAKL